MKADSDEKLVLKAQQGDENAFTELYERYHKRLEYVAMKLCKNQEDAKDAVQQTFLQVHTSLSSLREPARFYHWCCKIVHGKCTDMFRKNKDMHVDVENSAVTASIVEERCDYLPQKSIHFQSDREVLLSMIEQLPFAQRQVVLLVYFEQLSMQDCAAVLDIPEGTVKSRLHSAKKALKEIITLYNETSEAPLDFKGKTLEAVLLTALLSEFRQGESAAAVHIKKSYRFLTHPMMIQIVGFACCLAIGGALLSYGFYQHNDSEDVKAPEPIHYQDRIVYNSQEAYFLLRNWAVDERQMQNRSEQEKTEAKKLYDFLKQNDDAYYDILVADGWDQAFEALFE